MAENKRIVIVQPNAGLLEQAARVLLPAGWEVSGFNRVCHAIDMLKTGAFDAVVVSVGPKWFDAPVLLTGLAATNPALKLVAWFYETHEKTAEFLASKGIVSVTKAEQLPDALNASAPQGSEIANIGKTPAYVLIKAANMKAPAVFNTLMDKGINAWAVKHEGWDMVAGVQTEQLPELEKLADVEDTMVFENTVDTCGLDNALLSARRETINPISFGFAAVDFAPNTENITTKLALAPGVTAFVTDGKRALVQVAGPSLPIIRQTLSKGLYNQPDCLNIRLFPGLNILDVE